MNLQIVGCFGEDRDACSDSIMRLNHSHSNGKCSFVSGNIQAQALRLLSTFVRLTYIHPLRRDCHCNQRTQREQSGLAHFAEQEGGRRSQRERLSR
ncbi:MAG: hypothetical protein SNH27_11085 [Rikenellaceae bacterium]